MNRDDAVRISANTVEALWLSIGAGEGSWWNTPNHVYALEHLADFLDRAPGASAEVLYRHALGRRIRQMPWDGTQPALRVCLEIFRATYLALMALVRAAEAEAAAAAEAARPPAKPLADRGIGRRALRKRAGLLKRVRLGPTPPAAAPPVKGGAKKAKSAPKATSDQKTPSTR